MEIIAPNIKNFIKALRDIGYNFEIAVADIIDNSITANSDIIEISFLEKPELKFELLDNGTGMSEEELIEAMRLGTKNPLSQRENGDLGRFGLGLKTASFSQCKKLTVFSKKDGILVNRQWNLDYIEEKNEWFLLTIEEKEKYEYLDKLKRLDNGTLIIWELMDRCTERNTRELINTLRRHVALIFHRFLEKKKINIFINNNKVEAFNPFNIKHNATQQLKTEVIKTENGEKVIVSPFVLPHHSKVSEEEYDMYGTEEGYIKSQGFYLYRADRLLIYGTWFGLHKTSSADRLVRIAVDITNVNDIDWGIDIKKSIAKPTENIKVQLKRIIKEVVITGSRVYTRRGKTIEDKNTERFWKLHPEEEGKISFKLNYNNEICRKLIENLSEEKLEILMLYLRCVQEYIPLNAILAQLQQNPHKVCQKEYTVTEKEKIWKELLEAGLEEEYLKKLELFKE